MAFYEYTFLTRGDLSKNQVDELLEKVSQTVTQFKGKITKTEYWGLRYLAYKVKKNKKAHYCFLNLDVSSQCMKEIQRLASVNENILRTLVIKVDSLNDSPTPMMNQKPKTYNDDRSNSDGSNRKYSSQYQSHSAERTNKDEHTKNTNIHNEDSIANNE
ncbi:30S ribosomal protein S6 [Candidatus Hepatincola sp. Pdp]